MVPFEMKRLYHPKHPEVVRVNPKQQVPILIHGAVEIFDSTQIFEYFEHLQPQPPLWPADPADRARARLLELKSDEVYFPPIIRLMSLQETPADPVAITARDTAARYYDEMEATLRDREFLGGAYSYADIAFYMAQLFGTRMGAPMTDAHPRLRQWRDRMTARPAVWQVVAATSAHAQMSDAQRLTPPPPVTGTDLPRRAAHWHDCRACPRRRARPARRDWSRRSPR